MISGIFLNYGVWESPGGMRVLFRNPVRSQSRCGALGVRTPVHSLKAFWVAGFGPNKDSRA